MKDRRYGRVTSPLDLKYAAQLVLFGVKASLLSSHCDRSSQVTSAHPKHQG